MVGRRRSGTIVAVQLAAVQSRQGDRYVARCPDIEVTSQERGVEEALVSLRESLALRAERAEPPENLEPPIIATIRIPT